MKTKAIRTTDSSQKKKLFLPIFLASIMIFSVFAIIFSGSGGTPPQDFSTQEYKGYTFQDQGNGWSTTLNGRQVLLRYNPFTLESSLPDIDLGPVSAVLTSEKAYLSVFPGERVQLPLQELYVNMKPALPQLFLACLKEGEGCSDLPLKSCADARDGVSVLVLREGSAEGEATLDVTEGCFTLKGTERELLVLIDKLILSLHGL